MATGWHKRCGPGILVEPSARRLDLNANRLTRPAALRLAAAGAAGLALGARPRRAAVGDVPEVEAAARAFLASLGATDRGRATFSFDGAERTRWHWTIPASVPRNGLPLGALTREQRRLGLALLRVEQLGRRLRQGRRHHVAAGCAPAAGHGARRHVRRRSLLRVGLRYARRARVGMEVRGTPPVPALHDRRERARRRAVLPRGVADPGEQRLPLRRAGLPDDAPRGGRGARDRPLARPRAPSARRLLVGVADRPPHAERRSREAARAASACSRAIFRPRRSGACSRSSARTSRTIPPRSRATHSRGSSGRVSLARGSAGRAAHDGACRTTTACRGRRSSSSSTTHGTAALTSTASGATSSATSGATCCNGARSP